MKFCVVGCFWWLQRYHHNDFGADGDCAAMEVVVMVIASQQWPRHQMVTARVVSYRTHTAVTLLWGCVKTVENISRCKNFTPSPQLPGDDKTQIVFTLDHTYSHESEFR